MGDFPDEARRKRSKNQSGFFDKTIPHNEGNVPFPDSVPTVSMEQLCRAYRAINLTNPYIPPFHHNDQEEEDPIPTVSAANLSDLPAVASVLDDDDEDWDNPRMHSFPIYADPSPNKKKKKQQQLEDSKIPKKQPSRRATMPARWCSSRRSRDIEEGDIVYEKRCKAPPRPPETWVHQPSSFCYIYNDQITPEERQLLIDNSPVFRAFFYEMQFEMGPDHFRRVLIPQMDYQTFERLCKALRTNLESLKDEYPETLQIILSCAMKNEMYALEKQCLYHLQYTML